MVYEVAEESRDEEYQPGDGEPSPNRIDASEPFIRERSRRVLDDLKRFPFRDREDQPFETSACFVKLKKIIPLTRALACVMGIRVLGSSRRRVGVSIVWKAVMATRVDTARVYVLLPTL
ncbi:hypothetical protein V3C99_002287, partial [Haemonchus contortus]